MKARAILHLVLCPIALCSVGCDAGPLLPEAPVYAAAGCVTTPGTVVVAGSIYDDGRGPYVNAVDNAEVNLACNLHVRANGTGRKLRAMGVDLTNPVAGSSFGNVINSTLHLIVRDLRSMEVGSTIQTPARLLLTVGNSLYLLSWSNFAESGTAKVTASRISETQWSVWVPAEADVARLYRQKGTGTNVPGQHVGDYHVPFTLTFELAP